MSAELIGREKGAIAGVRVGRRMVIDCLHEAYGGKRDEFERMNDWQIVELHVELRKMGHVDNSPPPSEER